MSTYENTCENCGDTTITHGWVPGGDDGYKCPFCSAGESDPQTSLDGLDAAWEWFRGSQHVLMEFPEPFDLDSVEYKWGCFEINDDLNDIDEAWNNAKQPTRDEAVLAAWRAANENNEKGEG